MFLAHEGRDMSEYNKGERKKPLTGSGKQDEISNKKEASARAPRPDPRLSAFVRLLARNAAEKDFAHAARIQSRTRIFEKKE